MAELDVENKLAAARTRLIMDKPFLGALVLRLPLQPARSDWCRTTTSDARTLYYNAEYVEQLSLAETEFVLAQQALHCALLHFARRGHRIRNRWDLACDFAVNPILIHDGLTAPPDTLYSAEFEGMTAEEIYPLLQDDETEPSPDENLEDTPGERQRGPDDPTPAREEQRPDGEDKDRDEDRDEGEDTGTDRDGDEDRDRGESRGPESGTEEQAQPREREDGYPQGAHEPPPLSAQERETLEVQWKQRLAGAAQQAMQAGKLSRDLARLVDYVLAPKLPWRMLLAHYMTAQARDDYSYMRPSSRRGEPAILPSLRSQQVDVVIALDTSGSISREEMLEFLSEIDAIKGQIRARVVLQACDARLNPDGPWIFEAWERLVMPESFKGGGGTDFRPVFEWAGTLDREPDLLVYFTDAVGRFPAVPPHYPVIWLVKGKATVPWGQRIQLN
ncbi:MAG: VWA-like domain-containing protein [Thioalkalivibrio sp.]